jgi:hypothetical protein
MQCDEDGGEMVGQFGHEFVFRDLHFGKDVVNVGDGDGESWALFILGLLEALANHFLQKFHANTEISLP